MALFMFRGTGSAYWLPGTVEVADGGPTSAQLADENALDLTDAINGLSGFEPSQSPINVPILRSRQSAQIPGEETFGNPQIVLVEENGADTTDVSTLRELILTTLVADAVGTLVIFRTTQDPQTGDTCYFTRSTVASQVPNLTLDAAAATTAINLTPEYALRKGVLDPAGSA